MRGYAAQVLLSYRLAVRPQLSVGRDRPGAGERRFC